MTTATASRALPVDIRRNRITGIMLLLLGLSIFLFFGMGLESGLTTKFGLNPGIGSQAIRIPGGRADRAGLPSRGSSHRDCGVVLRDRVPDVGGSG
jgi:hypothetical protein